MHLCVSLWLRGTCAGWGCRLHASVPTQHAPAECGSTQCPPPFHKPLAGAPACQQSSALWQPPAAQTRPWWRWKVGGWMGGCSRRCLTAGPCRPKHAHVCAYWGHRSPAARARAGPGQAHMHFNHGLPCPPPTSMHACPCTCMRAGAYHELLHGPPAEASAQRIIDWIIERAPAKSKL